MEEINQSEKYAKSSVKGIATLAGRTFFVQIIAVAATFALTVFLKPAEYGVFFAVSALINFLVYFSDIGLAAALIQRRKIRDEHISTTFTIQQILVLGLTLISFILSPKISQFYNIGKAGTFLIQSLTISFFLSSLKTIPTILLERDLQFHKLVIPQILENIVFYFVAVFFAWKGEGITSFSYAVLLRGIVGLIAIYLIKPYFPRIYIKRDVAKKLINVGIFFQANSILALLKDDLMVLFISKILPMTQVGYIGWGQKWAFFPLRFVLDNVNKVAFPAYARVQDNKDLLKKALEKTIFWMATLIFPMMVGMIISVPSFVNYFPKYEKWLPALIALSFYCLNGIFGGLSNVFTNMLNSTGRIKKTLNIMVKMTTLNWILTPLGIKLVGYNGVAIASFLVAVFGLIALFYVRKFLDFNFFKNIFPAALSTLFMFLVFLMLKFIFISNLPTLFVGVFVSGLVYIISLFVIFGKVFRQELAFLLKQLK